MFGLKTLNRHAALMNRMAQVLGVDLTGAMETRHLSGEDWRAAVIRCTSCSDPAGCQHWLADHDAQDGAARPSAAPDYCNNRLMMARLRTILTEEPKAPVA